MSNIFVSVFTNRIACVCVAISLLAFAGCPKGTSSGRVKVRGVVKSNGTPINTGRIMFYPDAGGRPASGAIGADGSYELQTHKPGDGAAPGAYRVTIKAIKPGPVYDEFADNSKSKVEKMVWLFPEKFSDINTTKLTAEVLSTETTLNFDSADFE